MLKTIIYSITFFAFFASIGILIIDFGNWNKLFSHLLFAVFLGLIAAPELEPKAFKKPWLFQLTFGLIAGALFGYGINLEGSSLLASIIIGGLIGWSASLWLKYAPIP